MAPAPAATTSMDAAKDAATAVQKANEAAKK